MSLYEESPSDIKDYSQPERSKYTQERDMEQQKKQYALGKPTRIVIRAQIIQPENQPENQHE